MMADGGVFDHERAIELVYGGGVSPEGDTGTQEYPDLESVATGLAEYALEFVRTIDGDDERSFRGAVRDWNNGVLITVIRLGIYNWIEGHINVLQSAYRLESGLILFGRDDVDPDIDERLFMLAKYGPFLPVPGGEDDGYVQVLNMLNSLRPTEEQDEDHIDGFVARVCALLPQGDRRGQWLYVRQSLDSLWHSARDPIRGDFEQALLRSATIRRHLGEVLSTLTHGSEARRRLLPLYIATVADEGGLSSFLESDHWQDFVEEDMISAHSALLEYALVYLSRSCRYDHSGKINSPTLDDIIDLLCELDGTELSAVFATTFSDILETAVFVEDQRRFTYVLFQCLDRLLGRDEDSKHLIIPRGLNVLLHRLPVDPDAWGGRDWRTIRALLEADVCTERDSEEG